MMRAALPGTRAEVLLTGQICDLRIYTSRLCLTWARRINRNIALRRLMEAQVSDRTKSAGHFRQPKIGTTLPKWCRVIVKNKASRCDACFKRSFRILLEQHQGGANNGDARTQRCLPTHTLSQAKMCDGNNPNRVSRIQRSCNTSFGVLDTCSHQNQADASSCKGCNAEDKSPFGLT